MKKNSTFMLFYWAMTVGVMVSLSSNNWLSIWMGVEISLMSFLPLISTSGVLNSEATMKYFIIQSISSSLLIMSILMMMMNKNNFNLIIYMSLMIKMGVAPFHNWVISMIDGLSMMSTLFLLTLIKIPSMIMISYLLVKSYLMIISTIIVGSILGLNQNSIRKLIAYSSIFNMGFIISCLENNILWIEFFMIYSIMVTILILILMNNNINYLNQLMINDLNLLTKMIIWMNMLSMGGMPPLMGFINKFMVIEFLIQMKNTMVISLMVISSLMVMSYYMRMTYLSFMLSSIMIKWNIYLSMKSSFIYLVIMLITSPMLMTFKCLV
uniref:NADH-ubiquinone oxidoreductase chain 2 n=1 Tax=Signoretia aureola TaxID=2901393 RepID=A0A8K2ATY6_9HEMI|nr:NADH dehydrogenase subunit 2 [Signoretia aureola]